MSRWRRAEVHVSGGFFLLAAWFALENGWRPLALVLGAAALHEAGHLLALRAFGAAVRRLRVTAFGAVMDTDMGALSYGRELTVVLAGPAVNLLCAGVLTLFAGQAEILYTFAGSHLVLGCFNLLPIRPLDGGRALELLVCWGFGPAAGEAAARFTGAAAALALGGGVCFLMCRSGGNLWLAPAAAGLAAAGLGEIRGTRRKS